jgi:glycosyltransferase involved in cell wall biosynthesis
LRVALVHDYLTQYGGAERVLDALHEQYPEAPVFTSVLELDALPEHYREWDIRTSSMAKLPRVNTYHRGLLPLYPGAFRRFSDQLREFDVVLTDSSAWAHHAHGEPGAFHLCYCHSPARFLYGDSHYLRPAGLPGPAKIAMPPVFASLRAVDRRAAVIVDRYLANSRAVSDRIRLAYHREAQVVYPPVDVERFFSAEIPPVEPFFLALSRLVPHKRIDIAVAACSRAGIPLKVVGTGRALEDLKRIAGPTVEFLGWQPDDRVAELLRRCQAFILPGAEDFGITAVEAQAAGRPVIAYAAGGALESVINGETGLFFTAQSAASLHDAIDRFFTYSWDPVRIRANALRFNRERFRQEIAGIVESGLWSKQRRVTTSMLKPLPTETPMPASA